MGFGGAAIALTPQLLMKPATANGVPVPSKIGIPVEFPNFMPPDAAMQTSAVATGVRWTQAPSFDEVVAAYPAKAREKGVTGRATLVCSFADDGRLKNCSTLTQTPASAGFAAAAKKLTPLFVGPTERPDGKPMKGVLVQIPFTFTENMLKGGTASVGKPAWAAVPDFASMAANFPSAARAQGVITARVHLTCSVAANGAVEDGCLQVGEATEASLTARAIVSQVEVQQHEHARLRIHSHERDQPHPHPDAHVVAQEVKEPKGPYERKWHSQEHNECLRR